MTRLGDFQARSLDGSPVDLATYDGSVVLVVNTASQCGYASQMPGLQKLHDAYAGVGATWWIEQVHDGRGDLDTVLARVEAGP